MRRIAPVFDPRSDKTVHEGETLSFRVRATDANGDALTYSATGLPDGAAFEPETRRFTWTPGFDGAGDYEVTFMVGDGARSDSQTVGISVLNAIQKTAPTLTLRVSKTAKTLKGSGKLTPPHEGEEIFITLSRKISGVFTKIATNRDVLDDTGAYVTSFKRPLSGRCKMRSFFPGDEDHTSVGITKFFNC